MTPTSRMTPTCMSGVYTNFTISPSFKIKELILPWDPTDSSRFGSKPTIFEQAQECSISHRRR